MRPVAARVGPCGMTRVVVIGAGHNGLTAGIYLADHGVDVTVLEHAARPGGASSAFPGTLPRFVHDGHAAFLPMAAAILSPLPPLLGPLRVAGRLRRAGLEWGRRALGSVAALGHDVFEGD